MKINKPGLSIGNYRTFPYVKIIGSQTDFYVWIQLRPYHPGCGCYKAGEQGASGWIKGKAAFENFNKMNELLHSKKDKEAFMNHAIELHKKYKGKDYGQSSET